MNELYSKDIHFWKGILNDYFINAHRVISRIIPSAQKTVDFIHETNRRFGERRQLLGDDGLKEKAIELLKAKEELMVCV